MPEPLVDTFGRFHDSLRISVTDRCNIRCFYCMEEDQQQFAPRAEILSFEEIARFVRVAAGMGVTKLRLTGGEPLLRRDLPLLVRLLTAIPGIKDLPLTTNPQVFARAPPAPPHPHPPPPHTSPHPPPPLHRLPLPP